MSLLLMTSKAVSYALVCLVLCAARWGQNTVDIRWLMRKDGGESGHAMTPVRYGKNHNFV